MTLDQFIKKYQSSIPYDVFWRELKEMVIEEAQLIKLPKEGNNSKCLAKS